MRAKNEKEPTSSLSLSTGSLRMVWGHNQELFPALCPANLFPNTLLYLSKGLEKTAVLFLYQHTSSNTGAESCQEGCEVGERRDFKAQKDPNTICMT